MFLFLSPFLLLQLSASSGGPAGGRGWGFWQRWQGNYARDGDALAPKWAHKVTVCSHTASGGGWHCFTDRKRKQTSEMAPSPRSRLLPLCVFFFSLPKAQTHVQRLYNLLTSWKVFSVDVYTANASLCSLCLLCFGFVLQFVALSLIFPSNNTVVFANAGASALHLENIPPYKVLS